MRWVLLHSPLTGPAVWRPVAALAARQGVEVSIPSLPPLAGLAQPYAAISAAVAAQVTSGGPGAALVVHSGAGGLAANVVNAAGATFSQVVFVDAILPHPGRTWFSTTATAFGENVRAKAVDGAVPAWDQWFPPGALSGLVGDHAQRKAFVRELKPTPVAFLDEPAPELDIPEHVGWAYLRLSKAYEAEAKEARRSGRLTLRRDLNHLAPMTHAAEVVSSLRNLIRG